MKPLLAPLIFAAFATITAPIALLLNTFSNRSSKEKKTGTAAEETFLYPFFLFQVWLLETFSLVVLVSRYLL